MNPNIALSFQRPTFDPTEGQRNALAMRQAQMQEAATVMQLQAAQQGAVRDAAKRNALAKVDWNSPESLTGARTALGQAGDVDGVMAIDKYMQGLKKDQREAAAAELDAVTKVAPLLMAPETYSQGLDLAGRYSPSFAAKLPPQFDPKAAEGINRMAMGAKGWMEYQQQERAATETGRHNRAMEARPVAGVTVINGQQTAEQKEIGKDLVKQYADVRTTADNAQGEMAALEQLRNINVNSGRLEELKAGIASYAQALGVDPTKVGLPDPTNPQAFIGTAQQLVLRVMQAQKGPQTENDAKRIEQTVASLKNTPEAKDFLIDSAIAVRQRDIERADFYDAWREKNGTYDGARKAWRMYIEKVPLLGNNPKSGRPVFFHQFREAVEQANPGITGEQVLEAWRKKYGR